MPKPSSAMAERPRFGCQNRWVIATRPEPAVLAGDYIRLEPVEDHHLPALYEAIAQPAVFEYGFGGGLAALPEGLEGFRDWFARTHPEKNNTFAVVLVGGPRDGQVVGTTTLGDFDEHREAAHIGWTGYDPRVWGTAVNPEAKLLLLAHAFEDCGFGRVKIQTDAVNQRSQAAIAKLGATREGVLRRHTRRADGSFRDTVVFSILRDEWPTVRARLEARLG